MVARGKPVPERGTELGENAQTKARVVVAVVVAAVVVAAVVVAAVVVVAVVVVAVVVVVAMKIRPGGGLQLAVLFAAAVEVPAEGRIRATWGERCFSTRLPAGAPTARR